MLMSHLNTYMHIKHFRVKGPVHRALHWHCTPTLNVMLILLQLTTKLWPALVLLIFVNGGTRSNFINKKATTKHLAAHRSPNVYSLLEKWMHAKGADYICLCAAMLCYVMLQNTFYTTVLLFCFFWWYILFTLPYTLGLMYPYVLTLGNGLQGSRLIFSPVHPWKHSTNTSEWLGLSDIFGPFAQYAFNCGVLDGKDHFCGTVAWLKSM